MLDYLLGKLKENLGLQDNNEKADKVVDNNTLLAMGAGFIPIPVLDAVAISAIQADMLKKLCEIYEIEFREGNAQAWISSLSASALPSLGARAIKLIPGVGSVIGGISLAVLAGATTYATGKVFIKHFEEGGTMKNFEVDQFKRYYEMQFERGKAYAKEAQEDVKKRTKGFLDDFFSDEENREAAKAEAEKQAQAAPPPKRKDVVEELQKLIALKEQGLITEEEFSLLKKKLIQQ